MTRSIIMNQTNNASSLLESDQQHLGIYSQTIFKPHQAVNLIDLFYDGFYIVFLLKNGYAPQDHQAFREKILVLVNRFEQQAKKLQFSVEDIEDAKYAYCALLDETVVTQTDPRFFNLQNIWLINPLQLNLFGSQLAGDQFFQRLEQLRSKGKDRLAGLEIFYYCLLLGFQGKYRIGSVEHLKHLVARVGDEIEYLKGKKTAFAPYATLPDQIKNIIHHELPFLWVVMLLLLFTLLTFAGLRYLLANDEHTALSGYKNIIRPAIEQANIIIHLP